MADEEGPEPNVLVRILQQITPTPIRKSFALKFGLVLAVMALSIGGIGFLATQKISAETQDRAEEQFRTAAAQQADVVKEWLQSNRDKTRILSSNHAWTGNHTDDMAFALRQKRPKYGNDVFQMHIVREARNGSNLAVVASTSLNSGAILTTAGREFGTERVPTADMPEIRQLSTSDVYVSNTYEVSGRQAVGFLSPTAGSGRYLLVEVSISEIREKLQSGETRLTQVVNQNTHRIMIGEQPAETLTIYAENGSALRPFERVPDLRAETGTQAGVITDMAANNVIDEPYVVGYAPVSRTDWVLLVHSPRSATFGFVQTISNFGMVATLAAVLLIGATGTVLGYSTSTAIDRLTRKTEDMQEGDLDTSFHTTRIDNIGRLYDGFASMRDALKEQINEAEQARKEAEVSRAEAEEMSNYLQEKAQEYSDIMQQCAAGDLTRRMNPEGENEAMDQIASEFNDMIEELEKTTGQLKSYVDEVEAAGAEVERSAETVRKASEEVADSIQKIAADAEDQKERLQTISETMDGIADTLAQFAERHPDAEIESQLDRIDDIASEIRDIAELSEQTQNETDNVSAAAEEQAAELNEMSERAADLQRYAQPLRDILERFETESEHEFVFSVGPTGSAPGEEQEGTED